jgi:hypothetical protein
MTGIEHRHKNVPEGLDLQQQRFEKVISRG